MSGFIAEHPTPKIPRKDPFSAVLSRGKELLFLLGAIFSATIASCNGTEASHSEQNAPYGLWVWKSVEPKERFPLEIKSNNDAWQATIGSLAADITVQDNSVTVSSPTGEKFVGTFNGDGIRGYWHQSSTDLGYADVVTPISLLSSGDGEWTTEIAQQPRPFHVFLDVFKGDNDQALAVIRNPERNEVMRSSQFVIVRDSEASWSLSNGDFNQRGGHKLSQLSPDTLKLSHNWFPAPLKLRRTTEEDRNLYFARPNPSDEARYKNPDQLNDGWLVTSPEEAGFDRGILDEMTKALASFDPQSRRPQMLHSLLVAHKGKLVVEEYFHGHKRETAHDTRSLAKVFGPVLVGAMRQKGYSIAADDKPIESVLVTADEEVDDARKREITLAHLMTHSSGLDCNAISPESLGSEDRMWEQQGEPNFWLYTSRLPLLHQPGERYAYCSGSINLVGARIEAVAQKPLYEIFHELIAQPMKFDNYHWNLMPNGKGYLGGGVYMKPRDILKIGAMYAAGGIWNDQQIVGENWVKESTSAKIDITPETTGLSPEEFNNNYFGGQQAYIWRNDTVSANGISYASYEATGNGGQIVLVVPALDLAVVMTGGNYRMGYIWGRWRNNIVGKYIVPAMGSGKI